MCENKTQFGIDSYCYYYALTPAQKKNIMTEIKRHPGFHTIESNYFEETYLYTSSCLADQGLKLSLSKRKNSIWGLYIIVHPTLLLQDHDRSQLYQPEKDSYKKLVKNADKLLKPLCAPVSVTDMTITRIDVTANLLFSDTQLVEQYLHTIKKASLLPHYHRESFKQDDGKARDAKEANDHSYKQSCKSAAFFAYDKTAQLSMIGCASSTINGKRILRLECQLRRKSFKKQIGVENMTSNWAIIKSTGKRAADILCWYLKRMQLSHGLHMRYEDAVACIQTIKQEKMRKRMLYLLRKVSDSHDLTAAIKKLKEKCGLKSSQITRILKRFKQLGISPITLPNSSDLEQIPPLAQLLRHCS